MYIGHLGGNILTYVTVDSFAIQDKRGDYLVATGRITANYSIRDLIDYRIYVTRAEIAHPYVHLVQHSNDEWNFKEIFRTAPSTGVRPNQGLQVAKPRRLHGVRFDAREKRDVPDHDAVDARRKGRGARQCDSGASHESTQSRLENVRRLRSNVCMDECRRSDHARATRGSGQRSQVRTRVQGRVALGGRVRADVSVPACAGDRSPARRFRLVRRSSFRDARVHRHGEGQGVVGQRRETGPLSTRVRPGPPRSRRLPGALRHRDSQRLGRAQRRQLGVCDAAAHRRWHRSTS